MFIARLFLINAILHFKCEPEEVITNLLEYNKHLPKNVIDIYELAQQNLIIELTQNKTI